VEKENFGNILERKRKISWLMKEIQEGIMIQGMPKIKINLGSLHLPLNKKLRTQ